MQNDDGPRPDVAQYIGTGKFYRADVRIVGVNGANDVTIAAVGANPGWHILKDKLLPLPLTGNRNQLFLLWLVGITKFTRVIAFAHHCTFNPPHMKPFLPISTLNVPENTFAHESSS